MPAITPLFLGFIRVMAWTPNIVPIKYMGILSLEVPEPAYMIIYTTLSITTNINNGLNMLTAWVNLLK